MFTPLWAQGDLLSQPPTMRCSKQPHKYNNVACNCCKQPLAERTVNTTCAPASSPLDCPHTIWRVQQCAPPGDHEILSIDREGNLCEHTDLCVEHGARHAQPFRPERTASAATVRSTCSRDLWSLGGAGGRRGSAVTAPPPQWPPSSICGVQTAAGTCRGGNAVAAGALPAAGEPVQTDGDLVLALHSQVAFAFL